MVLQRSHTSHVGLVLTGLVLAMTLSTTRPAAAQGPLTIEVSPLRIELKMAAKASHTQAITLRNDSRAAVHTRARIDEYWLSQDGTPQFKLADPTAPFSASSWVRVNPSDFTIRPGESIVVRATTTAPASTPDGSYRCAVMFEFDPPGLDPKTARKDMQFRGRVAAIVYATVGSPKTAVDITDVQVQPTKDGAPDVVALLKNDGRGYVRTKGTVTVATADGRVVRTVQVPNVPVLPESTRELRVSLAGDAALEPGSYTVEMKLDVGQPALLVAETTIEVAKNK